MSDFSNKLISFIFLLVFTAIAQANPTVGSTTVLGPFAGPGASLHPDNTSPTIEFYGTDLGFSYLHNGNIEFIFGDSWADEDPLTAIESASAGPGSQRGDFDDAYGVVNYTTWNDPSTFNSSNIPTIKFGQHSGLADAKTLNPGHIMDLGKTPLAGFSNGTTEYGIFATSKPEGCYNDNDCDNQLSDLSCEKSIGFWLEEYDDEKGLTLACMDGTFGCLNDTKANAWGWPIAGTGFCIDETSPMWSNTDMGKLRSIGLRLTIGTRSTSNKSNYNNTQEWLTTKFLNIAATTAESFIPANGSGASNQDYNIANGSGGSRRVFLWGRPGFIGTNANGRSLGLYFAYVDIPVSGSFNWDVQYYTGSTGGIPNFSPYESDAELLDLNSSASGVQTNETYDIVDQMSIVWIDHLEKWVMFYGGGMSDIPANGFFQCGVLELFTGPDCTDVDLDNGAIRMRTADDPWGPWSLPEDVLVGGDPHAASLEGEYLPNGILRHPDCTTSNCAPHSETPAYNEDEEFGFLYGPNIVQPWIKPVGDDVDVIWNVSTWDPYGVVLLRTRINAN